MPGELTQLLHETTDTLRHARRPTAAAASDERPRHGLVLIWTSGVASPAKARFVDALERHLASNRIVIDSGNGAPDALLRSAGGELIHVHAETDVEALLEPALQSRVRAAAHTADLSVPVDWEPVDRSVMQVCELLIARGIVPPADERVSR